MRVDLLLAENWVRPGSRVLDLGCGDGQLLSHLASRCGVRGYGVEIDPGQICACVQRGVNVIEHNLDDGLQRFATDSFDTVFLTMALQVLARPHVVLDDMLRIGREAIVTFPNFAYWQARFYLTLTGKMPMSSALPYHWYDTPNIHLCTFCDFDALCAERGIKILDRQAVNHAQVGGPMMRLLPNLFGEIAIYRVQRRVSL